MVFSTHEINIRMQNVIIKGTKKIFNITIVLVVKGLDYKGDYQHVIPNI